MKAFISSLLLIGLSACSTSQGNLSGNEITSFEQFQMHCGWEVENENLCEALHGEKIKFFGGLYYPKSSGTASVFPTGTEIPVHDDDELWVSVPDDDITLRLTKNDMALNIKMKKLHTKSVIIHGRVNTECITRGRKAQDESDLRNKSVGPGDEIIITMLTGFCHYHSVYIEDFGINEIKQ